MKYSGIIKINNPSQSHWEMDQLLQVVESIKPKVVLEIGSHRGGSIRVWRDVFQPEVLIGINETNEIDGEIDGFSMVFGLSQHKPVFDEVVEKLGGRKIDFLFIDGGHYFDQVKTDWEMYSPLVREGGVVGFHDVMIRGNDTCEVFLFWRDLIGGNKTMTIWDGKGSGTGVLFYEPSV